MEIEFLGLSCFLIKSTGEEGREIKVLIDPFFEESKEKPHLLEADILILSQDKATSQVKGTPFLIKGPGEYEIGGIFVQGIGVGESIIYLIEGEGITLCHLNSLAKGDVGSDLLERAGSVDILMVPVGGNLGPERAGEIISQIEPKIVLPMDYKIAGLKKKKGQLGDFLKAFGVEEPETLKKLKIKGGRLSEETKVIILSPPG